MARPSREHASDVAQCAFSMNGSTPQPGPAAPAPKPPDRGQNLEEPELQAALQLLVERAQYITGATGAALALPQGEEMVCRASAGSSAPPVGISLQVRSGLTGEAMAQRRLLQCDNAEADPRVNVETCREMGIASIVVMPLLHRNKEVRGLFELFSDHPHAFEERDLTALQRMADLTLTLLDLTDNPPPEGSKDSAVPILTQEPASTAMSIGEVPPSSAHEDAAQDSELYTQPSRLEITPAGAPSAHSLATVPTGEASPLGAQDEVSSGGSGPVDSNPAATLPSVPDAMRRVRKCASCGFPVSEGRTLCVDCQQKQDLSAPLEPLPLPPTPAFLDTARLPEPSWLADHVNLLAIVVLILGILVALVVFR